MERISKKGLLLLAVLGCNFYGGQENAFASEALQEFVLDPMVVTAQGFATKDLETPALVECITKKKLKTAVPTMLTTYCRTPWELLLLPTVLTERIREP